MCLCVQIYISLPVDECVHSWGLQVWVCIVCIVCAAIRQPDCCFPLSSYKKGLVFSEWGCDVQLKGRIETDYLVNSWHTLAAQNRPESQGLICKWITSRWPSLPPLPHPLSLLTRTLLFLLLLFLGVHSVPRSSFYIVPWQMLCWAAHCSPSVFLGCRESQKISTCGIFFCITSITSLCRVFSSLCTSSEFWSR